MRTLTGKSFSNHVISEEDADDWVDTSDSELSETGSSVAADFSSGEDDEDENVFLEPLAFAGNNLEPDLQLRQPRPRIQSWEIWGSPAGVAVALEARAAGRLLTFDEHILLWPSEDWVSWVPQ
jgi:hypothetical protein